MSKRGGFPGGMPGNMNNLMKQAQRMQRQMEENQKELETKEFTAAAGGGAVEATVTGSKQLKAVKILPDAVDPEDVEMLQDMIVAAVNEAMTQAEKASEEAMSKMTGGLGSLGGLGGGFGF
ncbi:YbaB/EbfC family nucleoid-associated protein [Butyrivibrio sp. MC2013]|uniref:YbaB/EbfC family nucleoid-associated protein n=1 Tax=Butyrivibrio sp. MC2013 TaxID=1280686 RepID=UPI000426F079|nr:YbaB/EbfC family nucleoid-associated protein [Butyrivibrio sp. MC2013]